MWSRWNRHTSWLSCTSTHHWNAASCTGRAQVQTGPKIRRRSLQEGPLGLGGRNDVNVDEFKLGIGVGCTPIVDHMSCVAIVSTVIGQGPYRSLPSHVRCHCWTTLLEDLGQASSIATKGDFVSERLSFTSSSAFNLN